MAGDVKTLDFEALRATILSFNKHSNQAVEIGGVITSTMTGLMNNWEGSAADAFLAAAKRWDKGYEEASAALVELEKQMAEAHDTHMGRETERTNLNSNMGTGID